MPRALIAVAALPLLVGAAEPRLVPDVSQREIRIVYSFTGAELLLFGAIVYPGGRTPAHPPDIAIVVTGPAEALMVREKRRVAGMWLNADSARFRSVPSFYTIATSRPLAGLVDRRTAAVYELGTGSLQLSPSNGDAPETQARFEHGLAALKTGAGLWSQEQDRVEISEGVLYRARIHVPARVPTGTYTAETFLIRDGRVIAGASRDIRIEKAGFERFVADAALRWPVWYGLAAVAVSLLLGWAGALMFRTRR